MVAVSPEDLLWFVVVAGGIAMLTGWGIGANDVANSFGTSIGSGALTPRGALYIAAIFEFAGAFLMGSHVTDAIRKGIVDQDAFVGDEGRVVFMVGMCSALLAAGLWLLLASRYGMPVSTTHSTVGAVIGFSIAATGYRSVNWVKVGLIVLSWIVSPALAGILSYLGYIVVRSKILRRDQRGELVLFWLPIMAGGAVAVVAMFVIYKGSPALNLKDTPLWVALLCSIGIAALIAGVIRFVVVPRLRERMDMVLNSSQAELRRMVEEADAAKKGKTIVSIPGAEQTLPSADDNGSGSGLVQRPASGAGVIAAAQPAKPAQPAVPEPEMAEMQLVTGVPEQPAEPEPVDPLANLAVVTGLTVAVEGDDSAAVVPDASKAELPDADDPAAAMDTDDVAKPASDDHDATIGLTTSSGNGSAAATAPAAAGGPAAATTDPAPKQPTPRPADSLAPPAPADAAQAEPVSPLKADTLTMSQRKYLANLTINDDLHNAEDRVREFVFAVLQIFTASFESFAHGANDVANAMGPFAAIVAAYNGPLGEDVEVPWWILALGGVAIVVGLGTYGYHVMETIGKRIIEKITPSRGFTIELGATLTVLVASRAGLPVSTTHASVGSVVGVGFADGRNAITWPVVRNVVLSWVLTVPAAALVSAALFGFIRPAVLLQ